MLWNEPPKVSGKTVYNLKKHKYKAKFTRQGGVTAKEAAKIAQHILPQYEIHTVAANSSCIIVYR